MDSFPSFFLIFQTECYTVGTHQIRLSSFLSLLHSRIKGVICHTCEVFVYVFMWIQICICGGGVGGVHSCVLFLTGYPYYFYLEPNTYPFKKCYLSKRIIACICVHKCACMEVREQHCVLGSPSILLWIWKGRMQVIRLLQLVFRSTCRVMSSGQLGLS